MTSQWLKKLKDPIEMINHYLISYGVGYEAEKHTDLTLVRVKDERDASEVYKIDELLAALEKSGSSDEIRAVLYGPLAL